jgi:Cd2+/Zn2+-exporting ATPase
MNANSNTTKIYRSPLRWKEPSWFRKIKPHIELIAALVSGVLIAIGWYLSHEQLETATVITYISAYLIGGYAKAKEGIQNTLTEKQLNVELLMVLAAIGSAAIGYWSEGAILIFIFALSGALESYTMDKSRKEISALLNLQPETAVRIHNGSEEIVSVKHLMVGDIVLVKPGERIPVDGTIQEGTTYIDESALTGESMPVTKQAGDEVFAGTVNMRGSITLVMTKPSSQSLFQKIIRMVESAQSEKSPAQQFIERFEGTYVKVVLVLVGIMMVLPHYALGWTWQETLYRAMVLLVVASPCALVASIMPATLSAISNGARHGILFKGGVHLEKLGKLEAVAFDKTGTLTRGMPQVTDVFAREDLDEGELLRNVAAIERYSNHPLASAIVRAAEARGAVIPKAVNMEDIAGYGIQAEVEGETWMAGKADFVGRADAENFCAGIGARLEQQGKTIVYVRDNRGIAGVIALKDVIRDESVNAIRTLRKAGIHTMMITGDSRSTAAAIAAESGIDSYAAECLPEDKVTEMKKLKQRYRTVAMVGDGINDAPALATADVGVAMGEGTDVAMQTADVILVKNDLEKLAYAIKLSKRMNRIVKQNIVFSIAVILMLIISNFTQSLALPFGVIGHEGSTILVILNGLRLLR